LMLPKMLLSSIVVTYVVFCMFLLLFCRICILYVSLKIPSENMCVIWAYMLLLCLILIMPRYPIATYVSQTELDEINEACKRANLTKYAWMKRVLLEKAREKDVNRGKESESNHSGKNGQDGNKSEDID